RNGKRRVSSIRQRYRTRGTRRIHDLVAERQATGLETYGRRRSSACEAGSLWTVARVVSDGQRTVSGPRRCGRKDHSNGAARIAGKTRPAIVGLAEVAVGIDGADGQRIRCEICKSDGLGAALAPDRLAAEGQAGRRQLSRCIRQ